MNKVVSILVILFISSFAFAQSGIKFESGTWKEALAEAKENNKLIFLDAYTSWCGPCKAMTKNIFPIESVGSYFNKTFVNVKLDMEKGEGIEVAKAYKVKMYPTFLFVDGDGELVHRAVGYHQEMEFLELGSMAADPAMQLTSLANRYEGGDRDADLLRNFTKACFNTGEGGHGKIAVQYLNSQSDWGTEENMNFLLSYVDNAESKPYRYLVDNKASFVEMFGAEKVASKIKTMVYNAVYGAEGEALDLEKVDNYYAEAFGSDAESQSNQFRLMYYSRAKDYQKYMMTAVAHYDKYDAKTWSEYNSVAWTFFENTEDKKLLRKAVKWAKKSVAMESNYYNNDTLAALYYALGKKGKTIKTANHAIALAKADQMDYSETQKLLDKVSP